MISAGKKNNCVLFTTLKKPPKVVEMHINTIGFRERSSVLNEIDIVQSIKVIELKFEMLFHVEEEIEEIKKLLNIEGWLQIDESIPPLKGIFNAVEVSENFTGIFNVELHFIGSYDYFNKAADAMLAPQKMNAVEFFGIIDKTRKAINNEPESEPIDKKPKKEKLKRKITFN